LVLQTRSGRSGRCLAAERRSPAALPHSIALPVLAVLFGIQSLRPALALGQATARHEIAVFGANALVGGLTAGFGSWARGGAFPRAFLNGAAGGSLQYAGKRLVSAPTPGAGLGGRLVGATGASMVRNGAMGHAPFHLVVIPVGPINLHWRTDPDSGGITARLHLGRTVFLARMLLKEDLRLDLGETLSAGAPVFQAADRVIEGRGGRDVGGMELWATVVLSDPDLLPPFDRGHLLAHERVHVVQDDFLSIAWAGPIEDWALGRIPGGAWVRRRAEIGGVYMLVGGAMMVSLPYEKRPWEIEARYLEGGW